MKHITHKKNYLLLLALFCWRAEAAHWYVSVTGSDANDGSAQYPWRTIQHAIDTVAGSPLEREHIHIAAGTYEENLLIDSTNAYETLLGESAATTIVDGMNSVCLKMEGEQIEVSGITFQHSTVLIPGTPSACVWLRGQNNEIHDCVIRWSQGLYQAGVFMNGPNIFRDSEIYECETPNMNGTGAGLYIAGTNGSYVLRNYIHNNICRGSYGAGGIFFFYTTGVIEENIIDDNYCVNGAAAVHLKYGYPTFIKNSIQNNRSDNGPVVRIEGANPRFENNLIADNLASTGIHINEGFEIAQSNSFNLNTIVSAGTGILWQDCAAPNRHAPLLNSIIWADSIALTVTNSELELSYSCLSTNEYAGVGVFYDDPLFLDPDESDYHLKVDSPCIDAGDPSSDFCNEPFPHGCRVNIGSYGNTDEATNSTIFTCTPTCAATNTPEPTLPPTSIPTELPTLEPTEIPTETSSTPTATPTPTLPITFTPINTNTPTPVTTPPDETLSLKLDINDSYLSAGDRFILSLTILNPNETITFDQYICLEVYDHYFFYPSWEENVIATTRTLSAYSFISEMLLDIVLPTPLPSGGPFHFYGVLIDPMAGALLTNLETATIVLL